MLARSSAAIVCGIVILVGANPRSLAGSKPNATSQQAISKTLDSDSAARAWTRVADNYIDVWGDFSKQMTAAVQRRDLPAIVEIGFLKEQAFLLAMRAQEMSELEQMASLVTDPAKQNDREKLLTHSYKTNEFVFKNSISGLAKSAEASSLKDATNALKKGFDDALVQIVQPRLEALQKE